MQKRLFRVYFHAWKIHAWGVFWNSFYEDDIQPEKQVPPGLVDETQNKFPATFIQNLDKTYCSGWSSGTNKSFGKNSANGIHTMHCSKLKWDLFVLVDQVEQTNPLDKLS